MLTLINHTKFSLHLLFKTSNNFSLTTQQHAPTTLSAIIHAYVYETPAENRGQTVAYYPLCSG